MFPYNDAEHRSPFSAGSFQEHLPSWFELMNSHRTAGYYFQQHHQQHPMSLVDSVIDSAPHSVIKCEQTSVKCDDDSPTNSLSPATPLSIANGLVAGAPMLHFPSHIEDTGLSALSVVGSMMKDGGGGTATVAGANGFAAAAAAADFDYMHHMMQPLHLAMGRHSSQGGGSERHVSTDSSAPPPAPTKRSRSTHDGLMKCQYCPKKAPNEAALQRHMDDCRIIRAHSCDRCGKRFKARGGLQQHMRIHNNEKAYACHYCVKRFTQKSHLDQHERIHSGLKPFLCTFCGRAFRQRSQQIGHESTHLSHFNTQQQQQQQQRSTPSSSSSSSSTLSKDHQSDHSSAPPSNLHVALHPTPPTPSPEQQHQLNMAAAVMMQQHEISSLLALHNHEFAAVGGHQQAHFQQSAAEATAQGMRMLSHIAS